MCDIYVILMLYEFFFFSAESPFPANLMLALGHSMSVKGDCTNFEIEPSFGVEASEIYPEVKYTTVDNYLNAFVWSQNKPLHQNKPKTM